MRKNVTTLSSESHERQIRIAGNPAGEASHPGQASVRLSQRSTQRCVVPTVGVPVSVGSSLAMTQVDSEDSTSDLTPRPGLRFRRFLSCVDPHVSEVEVAHNQDARLANRFAVLGQSLGDSSFSSSGECGRRSGVRHDSRGSEVSGEEIPAPEDPVCHIHTCHQGRVGVVGHKLICAMNSPEERQ